MENNMKQKINVIFLAAVLLFAACKPQLEPPEDFTGNPEDIGLVVELTRLMLDKTELATIGGNSLKLTVTKTPEFASRSEVKWTSSNENAATVEEDGNGTVFTNAAITEPATTVIRVESITDSSIYAECPVTVYPNYGSNRYWNFGSNGWYASAVNAVAGQQIPFGSIVFTADSYLGNGMTLKGQTGSGSYENPTETPNGLRLEGGQIPSEANVSAYPPYPWVYELDPENPYAAGLTPTNNTRAGIRWDQSSDNQYADFTNEGSTRGFLMTNGVGRILSIAAIQGPFYIEVRYTTNSNLVARWADIRLGDTNGFRIQGSPSNHSTTTGIVNGTATVAGGIVSYTYTNNDIVPFVYIEAQASIRIYDVTIKTEEVETGYRPVESVIINPQTLALLDNQTGSLSAMVIPPVATNPAYQWEIIDGGENGTIVSGTDLGQATFKKIGKTGAFTVKLTVTTTNPDTGEKTVKTAEKRVDPMPYKPVTNVTISGDGSSVKNGETITLNAVITPADATYPAYSWAVEGAGAAIEGNAAGSSVVVRGVANSGDVTVKLTVKTEGYGGGVTAEKTADKAITLEAGSGVTNTWRFNATTATAAKPDWTANSSGYYEVTTATGAIDFGNGFKLVKGSSDTATAIRPAQNSSGLSPQISGCIQLSGSSPWNWGTLTGVDDGDSFTLEIIYANTGGSNTDRWPTVTVGGTATDVKGSSTDNTSAATTGTVTLTGDGGTIYLRASAAIRIFQVKLIK